MASVSTTPYPKAELVLQNARAMCNDAALSIAGSVLADNQPYVFPMLEERYEYLQDRLMSEGVNTFSKYGYCLGLLPSALPGDPTTQVQLSYLGYFDGVNQYGPDTDPIGPTLPDDLLQPLEIWERQSGSVDFWTPVVQAADAIGQRAVNSKLCIFDYENDILFFQGATFTNDIKLKYICYAPMLTDPDSQVMVIRCIPALAALMAEAAAKSRGGTEAAAMFKQQAEEAIKMIVSRTARKEQYASFNRMPFRGRRRGRR